jgi:hypothetical protein
MISMKAIVVGPFFKKHGKGRLYFTFDGVF